MPTQKPLPEPTVPAQRPTKIPALRVLASGSGGNCSILQSPHTKILIDAGLSPRRTRGLLADNGLALEDLDAILLTHLDGDHFHKGWAKGLPPGLPVFVHETHAPHARDRGLPRAACETFDDAIELSPDYSIFATLSAHDALGTSAFRFDFTTGASLGFATDLGSLTDELTTHLDGVDVLAIESNYCPIMQADSDRPAFLKARVMGGSGHLSNQECARLIDEVRPRNRVVLLHLSRQCNDPALVARMHARKPYALTLAHQTEPTAWIDITTEVARLSGPCVNPARRTGPPSEPCVKPARRAGPLPPKALFTRLGEPCHPAAK